MPLLDPMREIELGLLSRSLRGSLAASDDSVCGSGFAALSNNDEAQGQDRDRARPCESVDKKRADGRVAWRREDGPLGSNS